MLMHGAVMSMHNRYFDMIFNMELPLYELANRVVAYIRLLLKFRCLAFPLALTLRRAQDERPSVVPAPSDCIAIVPRCIEGCGNIPSDYVKTSTDRRYILRSLGEVEHSERAGKKAKIRFRKKSIVNSTSVMCQTYCNSQAHIAPGGKKKKRPVCAGRLPYILHSVSIFAFLPQRLVSHSIPHSSDAIRFLLATDSSHPFPTNVLMGMQYSNPCVFFCAMWLNYQVVLDYFSHLKSPIF